MNEIKKLTLPLTEEVIKSLRAGDILELSGVIYTGRDAAHKRLVELLDNNKPLPIEVNGGGIYYVGPTPAKPGRAIGSAGPTSSYRMDPYAEPLLKQGLKVMIGKGPRSEEYKDLLVKYNAVYLSAIGGAAASISESIKKCDLVCYEDLGAEAIYRLEVEDFFSIVTYDTLGNDLFEQGINKYKG
jgi:fumarate hydratase subunit beta